MAEPAVPPRGGDPEAAPAEVVRLSGIRRVVARRMAEAWRTIPAVTLHRGLPMQPLLAFRASVSAETGTRLSLDALLAGAVARALAEHPLLNGSWLDAEQAVAIQASRNVAVAVDTPHGLTAVVLRDADHRTPLELHTSLLELVARARDRRSLPADVADATFTITNLGALGIESFTPIITPPQAAVLGVGAIDAIADGKPAHVSLTFDHRVADGADAARFLATLATLVADPGGR